MTAVYPPEMAERFENAPAQARVCYRTGTYPAAHGWTEMLALLARNLHRGK
jgi:hypothetical protein